MLGFRYILNFDRIHVPPSSIHPPLPFSPQSPFFFCAILHGRQMDREVIFVFLCLDYLI